MRNRWAILALLFLGRTVMSFQFQIVGAVGPGLERIYGVGLAETGFAIGLYFLPGIVIAYPGARIGGWLGNARVVSVSLVFMAFGAAIMAVAETWDAFLAGQALAGIGGVTLNILMTKMVADWFSGREINTAMAIFINSWPLGIALSLVLMPLILAEFGISAGFWAVSVASLVFAVLTFVLYRAPDAASGAHVARALGRGDVAVAVLSGGVWGLFNAGLAVVFSFGTAYLVAGGATLDSAARTTSLVLWVTAILSPVGGLLADRVAQPYRLIAAGLVGMAVCIPLVPVVSGHWLVFVAIGVCTGAIAGAIMALPAIALSPAVRTNGMGLFFVMYYACFVSAPPLGGAVAEALGRLDSAFWLGGVFEVAALAMLWGYARTIRRRT